MKTCKEMALIWNISVRAVTSLCKSGRIPVLLRMEKVGKFQTKQQNR